eukprot:748539-Prymnesium_polylepis.1
MMHHSSPSTLRVGEFSNFRFFPDTVPIHVNFDHPSVVGMGLPWLTVCAVFLSVSYTHLRAHETLMNL